MFYNIVEEKPSFPSYLSSSALALIRVLLRKDPRRRPQSVRSIKRHEFFRGVNWDAMLAREVTPPWVPPLSQSNFDSEFTKLPINFEEKKDGSDLSRVKARASYYLERSNLLPDEVSFYSPGGNAAALESFAEGHSKKFSVPVPLPPAAANAVAGLHSPSSTVWTPMSEFSPKEMQAIKSSNKEMQKLCAESQ